MTQNTNTVIVHFDEHGELSYFAHGKHVRLFIVDERAPHDRVYEWLPRCDVVEIAEIIPKSAVIGSSKDRRHKAAKLRIIAATEGRDHLVLVDEGDAP